MRESLIIHKLAKYRFLAYFSFDLPWPFSPRDLISYAFAVDKLEKDGSIMVVVKGVTSESLPQHKDVISKYENPNNVCSECEYSGFLVKYISPGMFSSMQNYCDTLLRSFVQRRPMYK